MIKKKIKTIIKISSSYSGSMHGTDFYNRYVICPLCKKTFRINQYRIKKEIPCKKCHNTFTIKNDFYSSYCQDKEELNLTLDCHYIPKTKSDLKSHKNKIKKLKEKIEKLEDELYDLQKKYGYGDED